MATLAAVSFPRPEPVSADRTSVREDAAYGWRYLRERPGLVVLLCSPTGSSSRCWSPEADWPAVSAP